MKCFAVVLLLGFATTSAIHAADDEWVGQTVFPRINGVVVRDKDDKEVMKWGITGGKVIKAEKDSLLIKHGLIPAPNEGYVKKSDIVKLADAPKFYADKIKEDEKGTWARLCRGQALSALGELDKALKDFDEAIRLDPKLFAAFTERGSVWYAKEDYDKAIADYNEAIRLEPKYSSVFYNRGLAWNAKQDFDKALKDFDEAIRLNPADALSFHGRGLAWDSKQDYDKALKDFDEAIRLNPNEADFFFNRGRVWFAKVDYDKAIKDFSESIRLNPKDADTFVARGEAWYEKKEFDKAIKDYSEAIQLEPKSIVAFNDRGRAWEGKKEYDKAIKDYTEAVKLDPADADTNNGLAWLLATCPQAKYRDGKRAVELATKACEVSQWKDVASIDTLATAYAETGDFDQAVKFEKQAIEKLTKEDEKRLGDEFRARLKLFMDKKPYHEPEKKE
jgi:tetratricopeptide (TPR) repeat protein